MRPGTIQSGVDFAAAGATVNVAGGIYTELVTVNKTLTLKGSYAGVDARTRLADTGFALGSFTVSETIVNGPGGSFDLEADNIVLDGFTVEGATKGAAGILTSSAFSGYQIHNNIIESNDVGLSLGSSGANQTVIEQNWIKGNRTGVNAHQGLSNVLIESNLFSGSQKAIDLGGAAASLTNLTIANNDFQDGNDVQLSNVNSSTVSGNHFSGSLPGTFPPPPPGFVIPFVLIVVPTNPAVILGGGDADVTITGNTFTDRGGPAIQVADLGLGLGANSNILITDNTINQDVTLVVGYSNAGVALIDLDGVEGTTTVNGNLLSLSNHLLVPTTVYAVEIEGATTATINVTNNQFDGNDVDALHGTSAGIYLWGTLSVSGVINIKNNYLNGFVNGICANSLRNGTQVHANFNDLTGNSGAAVLNISDVINFPDFIVFPANVFVGSPPPPLQSPPAILDLQDNWWGVLSAQAISTQISGNATLQLVSPDTWLTSGLDTEPNLTGFQPDLKLILNLNTNPNQTPTLTPVPAQNVFRNHGAISIILSANDPDGDTVTLGAFLPSEVAFELRQQLRLTLDAGGVYSNFFGQGEAWLRGATNQFGNNWYYILPGGQLNAWDGSAQASGTEVATLSSTYAMNPSLLYAPPSPLPVQVSVSGNQLTIDPGTYVGSFEVIVEATDGRNTATSSFTVTVTNQAPIITSTADQTMAAARNQIIIPIAASDADNDPLTYSAVAGNLAYVLQQTYNLSFAGSLYVNYGGAQEKWLKGNTNQNGNSWYFIESSGLLYAWDGTANSATGTLLGTLDPIFYMRPDLIYNA